MLEKFRKNKEEYLQVSPYVNMYEKDNAIVLAVEMPGVEKNSLEVHLDGSQLLVRGKKRRDDIAKEYKSLYQERTLVEYERRFEINTEIDRDSIQAEYADGVLKITLARIQKAQPQKILIQA